MLAKARSEAAASVLVDTGDTLFPNGSGAPNDAERHRADLIAKVMGELHYDAMAVGERDLADGLEALQARADREHLTLLSANLADGSGKHPFAASKLVETPKGKVGIFAIDLVGADAVGLHAEDPAAAANKAYADLRNHGADAVVALIHGPSFEATKLMHDLHADLVLLGHDGRMGSLSAEPPVYGVGQKGRAVAKIAVELGVGPIRDASANADATNEVTLLDDLYKNLEQRQKAATTDQARTAIGAQMKLNRDRRAQAQARAEVHLGRSARLQLVNLDDSVADDGQIQARVDAEVAQDGHSPLR